MRSFITGIEGFVGHYLARALEEAGGQVAGSFYDEASVRDLDRYQLFPADLRTGSDIGPALKQFAPDIVYHLAAQSSAALSFKNPKLTFEVNVLGTLNLLEFLKTLERMPRLIIISSCEVYGPNFAGRPHRETDPYRPHSPYASSKASQELVALQYANTFGWEVVVARPFPHVGPGQSEMFALSSFAKQIAEIEAGAREPVIRVGNLESARDFCDVRDVVQAYRLLGERGVPGQIYNICSGQAQSLGRLLEILISYSRVPVAIEVDPERLRPADVPLLWGDGSKLAELCGWSPKIGLEKTLRDILDYWRSKIAEAGR